MVVSTMAALIVLVTAMYMSVLSSRQVQYATFDQEQAYVTSTSIGDMVYSYIAENMATNDSFVKSVQSLSQGESISTNGNGFAAFGGTNNDDARLGAVDVTITYLYDIDKQSLYDLSVTAEINGVYETTHTFLKIEPGAPSKMRRINNFFTSTGYIPSDIWARRITTDSTVYFDNEFVNFTKSFPGQADQDSFTYNVVAMGTLNVSGDARMGTSSTPLLWTIGTDFTNTSQKFFMNMSGKEDESDKNSAVQSDIRTTNHGVMIVGRDMHIDNGMDNRVPQYTDVYILGDLYLESGKLIASSGGGRIYVKGKLIKSNNASFDHCSSTNLIVNGGVCDTDGNRLPQYDSICGKWGTEDIQKVADFLTEKLSPSTWPAWEVKPAKDDKFDLHFNGDNNNTAYIKEDCTVGKWYKPTTGNQGQITIVIDTGKEGNVRTIKLTPNMADGNAFSWNPDGHFSNVNVITVGSGSLVINLGDEGEEVTYVDCYKTFFGHLAWYTALGGRISYNDHGLNFSYGVSSNSASTIRNNKLILTADDILAQAKNNSSYKCNYEKVTSTVTVNGKDQEVEHYTCTVHGGWFDIDNDENKTCQEIEDYNAIDANDIELRAKKSLCIGRVNHGDAKITGGFVDFYKSNPEAEKSIATFCDKYTVNHYNVDDLKYPNVNIFIACITQNAQINMGMVDIIVKDNNGVEKKLYSQDMSDCSYFGYVYAPYMTYYMNGTGSGTRAVGGLVVSDIVLAMNAEFLFCQPDVSISGMAGNSWSSLQSFADKSWRLSYGTT